MVKRILGHKTEYVIGHRHLLKEEIHNMYSVPDNSMVIKERLQQSAGTRHIWENNIKMNLERTEC